MIGWRKKPLERELELEEYGVGEGSSQQGQSSQRVPLTEYGFVKGSLECGM